MGLLNDVTCSVTLLVLCFDLACFASLTLTQVFCFLTLTRVFREPNSNTSVTLFGVLSCVCVLVLCVCLTCLCLCLPHMFVAVCG